MSSPLRVLMLLQNPALDANLEAVLAREGMQLVRPRDLTSESLVELIVTDHREWPALPSSIAEPRMRGLIGVVQWGGSASADVILPADASDREGVLACRLLGEVIRLRRSLARARGERRQLARLAAQDSLSGIANRRGWQQELQRRSAGGEALRLTLALLDVDFFKRLNDEQGHPAADRVLTAIGRALTASVRSEDFVARLGGDEFGVLVSGIDAPTARRLVERIRRAAGEAATAAAGTPVTLSAGFAQALPADATAEQLYEAADQALRAAKAAGRDCLRP